MHNPHWEKNKKKKGTGRLLFFMRWGVGGCLKRDMSSWGINKWGGWQMPCPMERGGKGVITSV